MTEIGSCKIKKFGARVPNNALGAVGAGQEKGPQHRGAERAVGK